MSDYHIGLPQGVFLTVEIGDYPIILKFTFPDKQEVTFTYLGNPKRTATVTTTKVENIPAVPATHPRKDPKAMAALGPLKKTFAPGKPSSQANALAAQQSNPQIEYVDPEGSEM